MPVLLLQFAITGFAAVHDELSPVTAASSCALFLLGAWVAVYLLQLPAAVGMAGILGHSELLIEHLVRAIGVVLQRLRLSGDGMARTIDVHVSLQEVGGAGVLFVLPRCVEDLLLILLVLQLGLLRAVETGVDEAGLVQQI